MVKLKWGMEYKGYLVSVDGYMNMQVRYFFFWTCFWLAHFLTKDVLTPTWHGHRLDHMLSVKMCRDVTQKHLENIYMYLWILLLHEHHVLSLMVYQFVLECRWVYCKLKQNKLYFSVTCFMITCTPKSVHLLTKFVENKPQGSVVFSCFQPQLNFSLTLRKSSSCQRLLLCRNFLPFFLSQAVQMLRRYKQVFNFVLLRMSLLLNLI